MYQSHERELVRISPVIQGESSSTFIIITNFGVTILIIMRTLVIDTDIKGE